MADLPPLVGSDGELLTPQPVLPVTKPPMPLWLKHSWIVVVGIGILGFTFVLPPNMLWVNIGFICLQISLMCWIILIAIPNLRHKKITQHREIPSDVFIIRPYQLPTALTQPDKFDLVVNVGVGILCAAILIFEWAIVSSVTEQPQQPNFGVTRFQVFLALTALSCGVARLIHNARKYRFLARYGEILVTPVLATSISTLQKESEAADLMIDFRVEHPDGTTFLGSDKYQVGKAASERWVKAGDKIAVLYVNEKFYRVL